MPFWPFNLRRRKTMNDTTVAEPLAEKSRNLQRATSQAQPSRPSSIRRKRKSRQTIDEQAERIEDKDAISTAPGKENFEGGFRRRESKEEVTALPVKWKLERSPHLRPVEPDRAAIPYSFLNNTMSQTSLGRGEGSSSKPATLRSKRSTMIGTPVRRKSSKKRPDHKLREEEIRAMSAAMPIPKRPGEGALRRDSYKRRTFTSGKESKVSLPQADSTVASPIEQNGWQVEHFWINPRPAVRLSQVPTYPLPSSADPSMPLPREMSQKVRDKMPVTRESDKRYKTVGADADTLGSMDIRAALDRDTKRREKREIEKQEKLDRKLRDLNESRRSSRRKQDAEAEKELEAGIATPAVSPRPGHDRAQSTVHPALRDEPMFSDDEEVGLGIAEEAQPETENPFETPVATPLAEEDKQLEQPGSPLETPFDDPVIQTAREVRMSTAVTPPLSPVDIRRRSSGLMNLEQLPPVSAASPPPLPVAAVQQSQTKRSGSESKDRRAGAWASFFKRSSTQRDPATAGTSFANTSRESMSRQPVPLHLVTSRENAFRRSSTGAPTRTQSKFREDLPDAPLSPPDSRVQSPDLPTNAAAAIAAATAAQKLAQEDTQAGAANPAHESTTVRSDTPVSPITRHGPMSASLASVDSEASWLASGGSMKRASAQSGLSRSFGSLRRRTPDFNASFEDLGVTGDKDAEYMQHSAEAQRSAKAAKRASGVSALAGASVEEDESQTDPMTVHDSVRRQPNLVHRDPVARSREGLLSEFSAQEARSAVKEDSGDEDDMAGEGAQLENARSITYGVRHARQVSAGSAKLLDVAPRRMSTTPATPISPTRVAEQSSPL